MIGFAFLVLAGIGGIVSVASYCKAATGDESFIRFGRAGVLISAAGIIAASILLLMDILQHNFSNAYVWEYSDRSLPLHFLISTFYAGQQGSFLFWTLCSVIISIFLLRYSKERNIESAVMAIFMLTQTFLIILLIAKSPFQSVYDAFAGQVEAGFIPPDGKGLNPLLQNFWMVIHPPVLFVGFAAMAVPFSFAVAGLWKKDFSHWVVNSFPWVLFSGVVLGTGIMLGAYWAYGVLGWGGYWGWDPVENSSLIPWIIATALIHTFIVQKRTGNLVRTNFFLAIISYLLVLYSTFLTRSGVLGDSSVHSFTDPGSLVYGLLMGTLGVFVLLGFGMMAVRWKDYPAPAMKMGLISRGFGLTIGSLLLLVIAAVIFFGTSLPIWSKTRVEPSFYDMANLPIVVVSLIVLGYSLLTKWDDESAADVFRRSLKWGIISAVAAAATIFLGVESIVTFLFIFSLFFTLFVNIEFAYIVSRGDARMMGGKISHIGLALFFLGVIASGNFGLKASRSLPVNTPVEVFGYKVTYLGSRQFEGEKFAFDIDVEKNGSVARLTPVMFNTGEQGVMRNPDIENFLMRDFYISPVSLEESQSYSIMKGDSIELSGCYVKFVSFDLQSHGGGMAAGADVIPIGAVLRISKGNQQEIITPAAFFKQGKPESFSPASSKLLGGSLRLSDLKIGMGDGKSMITVELAGGTGSVAGEALVADISVKPGMNMLWAGTFLLFVGMFIAMLHRKREA